MPAKKKSKTDPSQLDCSNPVLEEFNAMISDIQSTVSGEVHTRVSNHDDSPETISHVTNDIIKRMVRASRWA